MDCFHDLAAIIETHHSTAMTTTRSSTAILIAGSAIVATAVGYWTLSAKSTSGGNGYEVGDIDDEELNSDEIITSDEIVKIFDKLFLELQAAFAQLMQQVHQIEASGQKIEPKQLKGLIRAELERALTVKQKQIVEEEFDMDIACCEEATWEFVNEKNAAVCKAVERFQKMWENVTGEPVSGWKPGTDPSRPHIPDVELLGPEETIAAAETYFNSLTECMRTLVNDFKAAGRDLTDPSVQEDLNISFSNNVSDAGEEALNSSNVTMAQFEGSVKLHASNPIVARALGMLQMKQQQEMMAMGG